MNQNPAEAYRQHTAELLVFAAKEMGLRVFPAWSKAAKTYYCEADYTEELCDLIRNMSDADQARIIYDGRKGPSRALAEWWEEHLEADRQRLRKEQEKARHLNLRRSAWKKLTVAERLAVGLTDDDGFKVK